jgi:catechol 2,3-dioxygenase
LDFYCQVLGFEKADEDADGVALKPRQGEVLIKLIHDPQALPAESQTSGLYHFALLLPQRLDLARVLQHLLTSKVQLQGAADHLVSEALYLPDPEGNGIELYADRPRAQWPQMDGRLMMATDPLDFDSLLAELDRAPGSWEGIAAGTRLGHIHLHVGDLDIARYFYEQLLGFDMMAMYGLSAAFLAAGGYHHHIGINTWAGQGAPPPAPGSAGLDHFSIELPELEALHSIQERLDKAGAPLESLDGGLMTRDPFGAGVFLRSVAEFQA